MPLQHIAMIAILAMILVSGLFAAWHLRFQILGFVILVGSAYLLITSDMFLVIRLPTICVVGLGVLVSVFAFVPRPTLKNRQQKFDS